jgi:hypothetical protein
MQAKKQERKKKKKKKAHDISSHKLPDSGTKKDW